MKAWSVIALILTIAAAFSYITLSNSDFNYRNQTNARTGPLNTSPVPSAQQPTFNIHSNEPQSILNESDQIAIEPNAGVSANVVVAELKLREKVQKDAKIRFLLAKYKLPNPDNDDFFSLPNQAKEAWYSHHINQFVDNVDILNLANDIGVDNNLINFYSLLQQRQAEQVAISQQNHFSVKSTRRIDESQLKAQLLSTKLILAKLISKQIIEHS